MKKLTEQAEDLRAQLQRRRETVLLLEQRSSGLSAEIEKLRKQMEAMILEITPLQSQLEKIEKAIAREAEVEAAGGGDGA